MNKMCSYHIRLRQYVLYTYFCTTYQSSLSTHVPITQFISYQPQECKTSTDTAAGVTAMLNFVDFWVGREKLLNGTAFSEYSDFSEF